jgi:hypothetical protein
MNKDKFTISSSGNVYNAWNMDVSGSTNTTARLYGTNSNINNIYNSGNVDISGNMNCNTLNINGGINTTRFTG